MNEWKHLKKRYNRECAIRAATCRIIFYGTSAQGPPLCVYKKESKLGTTVQTRNFT